MAALESTPSVFERDLRSANRCWKRAKDNKTKWRFGNRHASGVVRDSTVNAPIAWRGGNMQHMAIKRPGLKPSDSTHCDPYKPKGRNLTKLERNHQSQNSRRIRVVSHVHEELMGGKVPAGGLDSSDSTWSIPNRSLLNTISLATATVPGVPETFEMNESEGSAPLSTEIQDGAVEEQPTASGSTSAGASVTETSPEASLPSTTSWLSTLFGVKNTAEAATASECYMREQEQSHADLEDATRSHSVFSNQSEKQADDFFYSFDSTDSPGHSGRAVSLDDYVRNPTARDTERLVAREYEILDDNGDCLKGPQARKALRKKAVPPTVPQSGEDGRAFAAGSGSSKEAKATDGKKAASVSRNKTGFVDDEGFELV